MVPFGRSSLGRDGSCRRTEEVEDEAAEEHELEEAQAEAEALLDAEARGNGTVDARAEVRRLRNQQPAYTQRAPAVPATTVGRGGRRGRRGGGPRQIPAPRQSVKSLRSATC